MSIYFPPTGTPQDDSSLNPSTEKDKKLSKDKKSESLNSFTPISIDERIKNVTISTILTSEKQESSPKSKEDDEFPHFRTSYSNLSISSSLSSSSSQSSSPVSSNASTPKHSASESPNPESLEIREINLEEESRPLAPLSVESAKVAQTILNKNFEDSEAFAKDNPVMEISEINLDDSEVFAKDKFEISETISDATIKPVPEPELNRYIPRAEDQIAIKEDAASSPFSIPLPSAITPQPNIEYGHVVQEFDFFTEDVSLPLFTPQAKSKEEQAKEAEIFQKSERLAPKKTVQKVLHSTVNSGIVDKMAKYLAFKQGLESPPKTNLELFELYKKSGKTASQITVRGVKQNLIQKIFNKPLSNWPENLKRLYTDIEKNRPA